MRRGEGIGLTFAKWAEALLDNSLSRYNDALTAAEQAGEQPAVMGAAPWGVLVEMIEAACRSKTSERAEDAFQRLSHTTSAVGTD